MNQKLLSSLTATLLITTLGGTPSGNAEQPKVDAPSSETNTKTTPIETASEKPPAQLETSQEEIKLGQQAPQAPEAASRKPLSQSATALKPSVKPSPDVVKVGEQQSQTTPSSDSEVIAKVHAHELAGHKAATLYVRNIPVLTFIGSGSIAPENVKMGTQAPDASASSSVADVKSLISPNIADDASPKLPEAPQNSLRRATTATVQASQDDPVWRATAIAAKLNQLNRDSIDANKITVSWDSQTGTRGERYDIKVSDSVLTTVDANTILPDTTRNLETDALQATNRLRRLLGNASPLSAVSGKPNRGQEISLGPIKFQLVGFASWYGPGFHGNASASGEMFNQNALTAAHRTLPFGTRVLVTNLDNGTSVVVRINDRGPYAGDRIIDLSAGAARVLGLISSGIAPVRLDVIDDQATTVAGN